MKKVILILLAISLVACQTSHRKKISQEEYDKKYEEAERKNKEYEDKINARKDWSKEDKALILAFKIKTGFTQEQVIEAWGYPKKTNKTITAKTIHEQWIYGWPHENTYLYFDNGILTTIQEM